MSDNSSSIGKVIVHPVMQSRELAQNIDVTDFDSVLHLASRFNDFGWSLDFLGERIKASRPTFAAGSIDNFAKFLSGLFPLHVTPAKTKVQVSVLDIHKKSISKIIKAAGNKVKADDLMSGFGRALPLLDFMEDLYGEEHPISIVCSHLNLMFDRDVGSTIDEKQRLAIGGSYGRFLQGLVKYFPKRGNSQKLKVIKYWFSLPFANPVGHDVDASSLPELARLGGFYRTLLLDRMCCDALDNEQVDPPIEDLGQWAWAFGCEGNKYQARRAIELASALLDQSEAWSGDSEDTAATFQNFFTQVEKIQNENGGKAFLSFDEAYLWGWEFRFNLPHLKFVRHDFPTQVARVLVEEADVAAAPSWDDWRELINESLAIGYVKFAQSLGAYVLLESIVQERCVKEWESLIQIIRTLKRELHYEIFIKALTTSAEFFRINKQELLALRLDSFISNGPSPSKSAIQFVYEANPRISRAEVELRLIEHISDASWRKFSSETKGYLIEADYNWSVWRFSKERREDFSHIGIDFSKAIEKELVSKYGKGCVDLGLVPRGKPTLGSVVRFLKNAVEGEGNEMDLLVKLNGRLPSAELIKELSKFNHEFRNSSAHPELFDINKVDKMRRILFQKRLLRRLCDELL